MKRYTLEQLQEIVDQLRAVKIDGEPVMSVRVEDDNLPDRKRIVMQNWGTTAILEFYVKRWPSDGDN